MTNTLNTPAEAIEMQYPLRVRAFEARENGGGGTYCGGGGIYREVEALADCEGTLLGDRRAGSQGAGPYGLSGGAPGARAQDWIRRAATGEDEVFPGGKWKFRLKKGDRLCIRTPGGGGWGAAE
jgi:N-methylhydantoinase B